jgi:hypothetical protein
MAEDSGFGVALGDFGGAVSSLFGSAGSKAEAEGDITAAGYAGQAAQIERRNAGYELISTSLKQVGLSRQINMAMGKTEAQLGGANLSGGSAGDLLRMGTTQGGLAKSTVAIQGALNYNSRIEKALGFDAQQSADMSAAAKAESAAGAGIFGAIFKGAAGIMALL